MKVPQQPKIYHIVHVDRLPSILADGNLQCDRAMMARTGTGTTIGMSNIKTRRLRLPVHCHEGTFVGDYVPFYFCPRSIMLYVLHRNDHVDVAYRGGQAPIVHLEADLIETIDFAQKVNRRWAFSLSNAGATYAKFRTGEDKLNELNWTAIAARDFRAPEIKESKQAEFLIHHSFPWEQVRRIGVFSPSVHKQVLDILRTHSHKLQVEIRADWYY